MGVDYRAGSGYGFEIPYDDAEEIAQRLGFPESEWGFDDNDFGQWLTEGADLVYDVCGNFMGGEDIYLIIEAARVGKSIDMYGWDGSFQKFSEMRVSDEQQRQLEEVFERVYQRPPVDGEISWYMSTTVS